MPTSSKKRGSTARRSTSSKRQSSRSSTDAIALLKKDHQTVRQLLKRLESSSEGNRAAREQLLGQIENEIKVHTQIEEEIFYPAFREAAKASDEHIYFEALEEHHVVDMVMPEIKSADEGSEEFTAKAKVLKDLIEHHAAEEENQMFPKARTAMGTAELREVGERMQQRKQQLTAGSTAGSVSGGTIQRILQPFTGESGKTRKTTSTRKRKAA
jgi:hemerythrin-like domain-containing protein